jgi:anti-sigma factor RsiW
VPGPYLPEGASLIHLTNDPDEAARAPAGDAIVADLASAIQALLDAAKPTQRPAPAPRPPIPDIEHAQRTVRIMAIPAGAERALPKSFTFDAVVFGALLPGALIFPEEVGALAAGVRYRWRHDGG